MHTLEPLCNLEQSTLLKELGMNEVTTYAFVYDQDWRHFSDNIRDAYQLIKDEDNNGDPDFICCPTISMARNWVWEKYKLWIGTTYNPTTQSFYSMAWTDFILPFTKVNKSHIEAESECLTEILKHLKAQKQ